MHVGTKLALQKEADLTRVYEVQELDELTEQWLQEKLCSMLGMKHESEFCCHDQFDPLTIGGFEGA